jgi:hypothetical protein
MPPTMMVASLHPRGHLVAQAREERVDFMAVTAMSQPGFRTIARFQQCQLKALGDLLVQLLKLCRPPGLAKLGHVALDGAKVRSNASVHKGMSCGRVLETEKRLTADVSIRRSGSIVYAQSRRSRPKPRSRFQMMTGRADPPGMMKSRKPDRAPDGGSPDRKQRNFTNPDATSSRPGPVP